MLTQILLSLTAIISIKGEILATNEHVGVHHHCESSLDLDLMFVLDTSRSVLSQDPTEADVYVNWKAEIDFCKSVVNNSLPDNSRAGLIIFGGCSRWSSLEQCIKHERIKLMWELNTFGTPYNDQQALYDRIEQLDENDFTGGYTWTNDALGLALNEFRKNSDKNRKKMIILVTDGEPYPNNKKPCDSSGYESTELTLLKQMGVTIVTVGIDLDLDVIHQFFSCVSKPEHMFEIDSFDLLGEVIESMETVVCTNRFIETDTDTENEDFECECECECVPESNDSGYSNDYHDHDSHWGWGLPRRNGHRN